jgi:hypothetical protein
MCHGGLRIGGPCGLAARPRRLVVVVPMTTSGVPRTHNVRKGGSGRSTDQTAMAAPVASGFDARRYAAQPARSSGPQSSEP